MSISKEQVDNIDIKDLMVTISYIPEIHRDDKEVVLSAVKKNGLVLRMASGNLKNDRDVVLAALNEDGNALKYVSSDLKQDLEIVKVAVNNNGEALVYAPENLRNNEEIVLLAIKKSAYALNYASERLKNDKEFAIKAMSENVCAIMHMSKWVQDEKGVLELLKKNKNKVFELDEWKEFFNEKMKVLEILEEEEWMRNNVQKSEFSVKKRKF